jgi:hypothetical protein
MNDAALLSVDEALAQAYGPNPLLEALESSVSVDDMPAMLSNRPLDRIPWQSVPTRQRYDFVKLLGSHFVPTAAAVEIALVVQRTLRMSYVERNPLNRETRRRLYRIAALRDFDVDVVSAPWFPTYASGVLLKGITGLGKSTIVERVFAHYRQSFDQADTPSAGWHALKQIVYLVVSMSADHSRRGFLLGILKAVDEAADREYYQEFSKTTMTVERLMIVVGSILSNHRCGYLVIEEIQKRNFGPGESRALLLLFFLRLLNMGIPVLLIGNPEGFRGFSNFTQDVRRLCKDGYFELWPAESENDCEWFENFVDGELSFNLLDTPFKLKHEDRTVIFQCTGGNHGYFAQLYGVTLDRAIRKGRTQLCLDDFREAYESEQMAMYRGTIAALASRDYKNLLPFEDISAEDFAIHWGCDLDSLRTEAAASSLKSSAVRHGPHPTKPRTSFSEAENEYETKKSRKNNRSSEKSDSSRSSINDLKAAFKKEKDALRKMMNGRKHI